MKFISSYKRKEMGQSQIRELYLFSQVLCLRGFSSLMCCNQEDSSQTSPRVAGERIHLHSHICCIREDSFSSSSTCCSWEDSSPSSSMYCSIRHHLHLRHVATAVIIFIFSHVLQPRKFDVSSDSWTKKLKKTKVFFWKFLLLSKI